MAITMHGADELERSQLQAAETQLRATFPRNWDALNDARQNALIEMAYQMGVEKELAFHTTLECVWSGDWAGAYAAGMESLWAKQTPARAERVLAQLRDGTFPVQA